MRERGSCSPHRRPDSESGSEKRAAGGTHAADRDDRDAGGVLRDGGDRALEPAPCGDEHRRRGLRARSRHGAAPGDVAHAQAANDLRRALGGPDAARLHRERRGLRRLGSVSQDGAALAPLRLHGRGLHPSRAGADRQRGLHAGRGGGSLRPPGRGGERQGRGRRPRLVRDRGQDDRRPGCRSRATTARAAGRDRGARGAQAGGPTVRTDVVEFRFPSLLLSSENRMDQALLSKTAAAMVAKGKGLLAADESSGTCETRFKSVNVECTEENRRAYRGLLFTTPGVEQFVSGVILYDETIRQKTNDAVAFPDYLATKGILPGIKVDSGAKNLALCAGEKVTEGLDGLRERLAAYFKLGARFAKWRAVIAIGEGIPSHACLYANAHALARYAALCQEASIVPMIEPEVLLDGDHTIQRCEEVTEATLRATYAALAAHSVSFEHTILKASMVVSGKACPRQPGVDEVAERTLRVLKRTVPAAQPGGGFLSGGQAE